MRTIAIVGGGQSGAQLALGLLKAGYEVTLVSDRAPEELRAGRVLSSQCMFASALESERVLGLDHWQDECPAVEGIAFTTPGGGVEGIRWAARLDAPARSVDQRLKVPAWLEELERGGGRLPLEEAGAADLERYAREHELVVVSTGKGTSPGCSRATRRSPRSTGPSGRSRSPTSSAWSPGRSSPPCPSTPSRRSGSTSSSLRSPPPGRARSWSSRASRAARWIAGRTCGRRRSTSVARLSFSSGSSRRRPRAVATWS